RSSSTGRAAAVRVAERRSAPAIIGPVPPPPVRASMHHEPPVWVGRVRGREIRRRTRDGCLNGLRRLAGPDALLWVGVPPDVVGVSEAATILGWDRRRVATYVSRGAFPE